MGTAGAALGISTDGFEIFTNHPPQTFVGFTTKFLQSLINYLQTLSLSFLNNIGNIILLLPKLALLLLYLAKFMQTC